MSQSTFDKIVPYLAVLFVLWGLISFSLYIYHEFTSPPEDDTIIFNIIGIVNSTNATTLVSLQYECIKFCGTNLDYASSDSIRICMDQCIKLGKEECK